MLPGLAIFLVGYTLTFFGWDSLQGPGTGLLDLIVPGRYKGATKNSPGEPSGSAVPASVAAGAVAPPQGVSVGPNGQVGVTISDQPAPNVSIGPGGAINVSIGG